MEQLIGGCVVHQCVFSTRSDNSTDDDHSDDGSKNISTQCQLLHQGHRCLLGNLLQLYLWGTHWVCCGSLLYPVTRRLTRTPGERLLTILFSSLLWSLLLRSQSLFSWWQSSSSPSFSSSCHHELFMVSWTSASRFLFFCFYLKLILSHCLAVRPPHAWLWWWNERHRHDHLQSLQES